MNSIGPMTDPCGTPNNKHRTSDEASSTDTHWDRAARYEGNQAKCFPPSPRSPSNHGQWCRMPPINIIGPEPQSSVHWLPTKCRFSNAEVLSQCYALFCMLTPSFRQVHVLAYSLLFTWLPVFQWSLTAWISSIQVDSVSAVPDPDWISLWEV